MLAYSPPDARLTVNACRRRGGDPRRTWRFSGGRNSETGSGGGPMWRALGTLRSGVGRRVRISFAPAASQLRTWLPPPGRREFLLSGLRGKHGGAIGWWFGDT
jgi:hypothetical protein